MEIRYTSTVGSTNCKHRGNSRVQFYFVSEIHQPTNYDFSTSFCQVLVTVRHFSMCVFYHCPFYELGTEQTVSRPFATIPEGPQGRDSAEGDVLPRPSRSPVTSSLTCVRFRTRGERRGRPGPGSRKWRVTECAPTMIQT